jgi:hypothetical protein
MSDTPQEHAVSKATKAVAGIGIGGMATVIIFLVNQLMGVQKDLQHMEDLHNEHTPVMIELKNEIRSLTARTDELYLRIDK